ncbi:unknown [Bacteroides sp. CAG:1060]|nr:unknown [Bacteroides sp. CAG:1060]
MEILREVGMESEQELREAGEREFHIVDFYVSEHVSHFRNTGEPAVDSASDSAERVFEVKCLHAEVVDIPFEVSLLYFYYGFVVRKDSAEVGNGLHGYDARPEIRRHPHFFDVFRERLRVVVCHGVPLESEVGPAVPEMEVLDLCLTQSDGKTSAQLVYRVS